MADMLQSPTMLQSHSVESDEMDKMKIGGGLITLDSSVITWITFLVIIWCSGDKNGM